MWPLATAAAVVLIEVASAQTRITAPKNKYTPEQDVKLGREAAAEIRTRYPVVNDSALTGYLDRLGKRLVAAAPDDWDTKFNFELTRSLLNRLREEPETPRRLLFELLSPQSPRSGGTAPPRRTG